MTRKEAGKYLGLAYHTLDVWASTGKSDLKYYKIGRRCVYRKSDLDEFLASTVTTCSRPKPIPAEPPSVPAGPAEQLVNNSADRETLMIISQGLVNLTDVIKRQSKMPIYNNGIPSKAYKAVLDVMRDCFHELRATMEGSTEEAQEYRDFVNKGLQQLRLSGLV